jgi:SAM-dependent methyltransferase
MRALKRSLARVLSRFEATRALLVHYYDRKGNGIRAHPFDSQYGIQTTSLIPGYALLRDAGEAAGTAYAASQPSVIRAALGLVKDHEHTVLIDLGCGKGRVLIVGSEFPFREVIGVEISGTLAAMARSNIAIVRRTFPTRPPIRVAVANAMTYALPDVPVAIFLYRPFSAAGTATLLAHIETALQQRSHPLSIIYYNPVWGALFDDSPFLTRAHALSVPYDQSEVGFNPDVDDSVVIWQDRRFAAPPSPEARRKILVVGDWRAELAPLGTGP